MASSLKTKHQILVKLRDLINIKVEEAKRALVSIKESRNNETKSSAGDKHETGRAIMQNEMDKLEDHLNKAINLQKELSRINIQKVYTKVELGSLVITNYEKYFFSIGFGKLEIDNDTYYVISMASPVGMLLKDKKSGDKVQFQGRDIIIKEVF